MLRESLRLLSGLASIYSLRHTIGREKKVDGMVCVLNIAGSGKTCGVDIAMATK